MAATNNTCVICLEPLLTSAEDGHEDKKDNAKMCDFGACSPCGHPAHESCFRQWATFQNSGNSVKQKTKNCGIPCPTCHMETTSFVKIYLRVEDKQAVSGSDDEEEEECEEASDRPKPNPSPRAAAKGNCKKKSNHKQQKEATKLSKKTQWYKKRWMGKCEEVKILKLEAQNRKKCHHHDLVDLERSQMTNFRLSKELERTIDAARLHRNFLGMACFAVGWIISRKLTGDGGVVELM
jgi:hypothetical protein